MASKLPSTYKKLVVKKVTTDIRNAVVVETLPLNPPGPNEILVKNKYVGVSTDDIDILLGRHSPKASPPFDIGFEGVGEVVAIGDNVTNIKVGQALVYRSPKTFAEYVFRPGGAIYTIPEARPEYVALLVGGITAAVGLDKIGRIIESDTVLIIKASGGIGHMAVQWAKAAGCHVIGTCSSPEKASFLKTLGCDRAINVKAEDLGEVLKREYPNGIDVIWETVGGSVFHTCVENLSVKGRLIFVERKPVHKSEESMEPKYSLSYLPGLLLQKSASVQGYLVRHYHECFPAYFEYLKQRFAEGKLRTVLDDGKDSYGTEFSGFQGIIDALVHLHSGQSIGKVLVKMP